MATTLGTLALLTAFLSYRRDERRGAAPRPARWTSGKAVVDPLNAMWTELNWIVTEDPWMDHTLTDIDRVMALVSEPDEPLIPSRVGPLSALDAVDIDAIMNDVRARSGNHRREPARDDGPSDALRTYLQSLGGHVPERDPELLLLIR